MLNHLQLLFLASFLSTFIILYNLSNFFSSKLREAGYDISRLILIGLPQSESTMSMSVLEVGQSVVPQVAAIALAAATSAFIYVKFGRTGTSSFPTCDATSSHFSATQ